MKLMVRRSNWFISFRSTGVILENWVVLSDDQVPAVWKEDRRPF